MNHADIETIRRLYEADRQALFTYALAITRDASMAEDAVHAAFAGVLNRASLPYALRPYLFRCVRNAALDRCAQAARGAPDALFSANGHGDPALSLMAEEALASLSADDREAVVLKIYGGLTFRDIAKTTGEPLHTVAARYRRALVKLRKFMENDA